MSPDVTVRTVDLAKTLDLLEGLEVILDTLDQERRGRAGAEPLVEALLDLDSYGATCWEPLRYQDDAGIGWTFMRDHVKELRERLIGPYSQAAL